MVPEIHRMTFFQGALALAGLAHTFVSKGWRLFGARPLLPIGLVHVIIAVGIWQNGISWMDLGRQRCLGISGDLHGNVMGPAWSNEAEKARDD